VCQNLVPLVNIKIAGKWMFIPLKMVLIGIDPYPYTKMRPQCGLRTPMLIPPKMPSSSWRTVPSWWLGSQVPTCRSWASRTWATHPLQALATSAGRLREHLVRHAKKRHVCFQWKWKNRRLLCGLRGDNRIFGILVWKKAASTDYITCRCMVCCEVP